MSADTVLIELQELRSYPAPASARVVNGMEVVVPLRLSAGDRVLSFLSTTTVFGTPVEITLSKLALESIFPADAETADALRNCMILNPGWPHLRDSAGRAAFSGKLGPIPFGHVAPAAQGGYQAAGLTILRSATCRSCWGLIRAEPTPTRSCLIPRAPTSTAA